MKTIIVDRHPFTVSWLRSKGVTGDHVVDLNFRDALNAHIYGPCPLGLAAVADRVSVVRFPRMPAAEHRRYLDGTLTFEEFERLGAHIRTYQVRQVDGPSY